MGLPLRKAITWDCPYGRGVRLAEKTKVQLVVPNEGTVATELMLMLMNLIYDGRYELHFSFPMYRPISHARNKIAREFLQAEPPFDYLLMIDSDVVPSVNPLDLVDDDLDVVGHIYPIWKADQEPGHEVMWGVEPLGELAVAQGLVEVAAIGTGCVMIARRVLEHPAMRAPFRERFDEDGLLQRGEDLAFCDRARAAGFRVWADLGARCSHQKLVDLRQVGRAIDHVRADGVVDQTMREIGIRKFREAAEAERAQLFVRE